MYLAKRWGALALASLGLTMSWAWAAAPVLNLGSDISGGYVSFPYTSVQASVFAGDPFKYQIHATNATAYEVQGLPAGLMVDPSTGLISGTPAQAGSFPLTVKVTNADGATTGTATLTIEPAPTAAPEVAHISDLETTYHGAYLGNDMGNYYSRLVLNASQRPTHFSIAGFPVGELNTGNGSVDATAAYAVVISPVGQGTPGIYTCTVTAGNEFGSQSTQFMWRIHPALVDFGITSQQGAYHLGDVVTFLAKFTGPVVVTGHPVIHTTNGDAVYASGSGTDTLTFTYQTTASDADFSGYVPQSIDVNGGTIASPDGLDAGFGAGLSAPSLRDTVPPSYRVYLPHFPNPTGTGTVGAVFSLLQSNHIGAASYAVIRGALPDGTNLNTATGDITGTPTKQGTWNLTLQATAPSGQTVTQDMTITINPAGTPVPMASIISVTGPAKAYVNGNFNITVTYDVPVYLTGTNQPSLTVNIGSAHITASASGGTVDKPSPQLTFSCSFAADANFNGPVSVAGPIALNGGSVLSNGQPASLTFSSTNLNGLMVDMTAPVTPTIQVETPSATPVFFGTAEPSTSIAVVCYLTSPATVKLATTADANGTWRAAWNGAPLAPGAYDVFVDSTDQAGNTTTALLVLTVPGGPTTLPPTTTTPPPSTDTPPPTSTTPPPPTPSATKADQTITFSSPVGALIVGQPIMLGALSSAALPVTYSVVSGDATITGNTLTPKSTAVLTVRASSAGSDTVNPASVDVNFGAPQKAAQSITGTTAAISVPAEKPVALSASTSSGLPVTYSVVSGPATISGSTLTFTGTGTVTVRASQSGDGTYAAANDVTLTFTAVPVNRLVNLSSRVHVAAGDVSSDAIAGFVVTGDAPKKILIRGVGPSLGTFGVADPVAAPALALFDAKGVSIATNAGWNDDAQIAAAGDAVGAFKLGHGSHDAALLISLAPGSYTVQVTSSASGTALLEVYDVAANSAVPTKQLVNISTRATLANGDDVVIAGFVVAGAAPKRVLIRAVGPGLTAFNVPRTLSDPMLKLYDAKGVVLARNDNWETPQPIDVLQFSTTAADVNAADTAAGAFALQPGSKDAALVVTLSPGAYTAILSGAAGATGAALVEVYELP